MSIATALPGRAIPIVASLATLVLCAGAGCSSVSGGIKSPVSPPSGPSMLASGQRIGRVAVSLDQENLPSEVTEVAELYEVPRILGNRLREQLALSDTSSGGGLEVAVEVIGMRLRSNGTAIWWGFMAGGDWITVDVGVTDSEDGATIKRFQTGTATALGGFVFGGRSVRVGRMMKTLAKRIADGI
jgi:hypothetical protein